LHPTGQWTAQQARNLLMDLGERAEQVKFMIRDRGSNFTVAFDAVLADASIRTVLCNVRTPRMNAITERWIGGCRRELLDRTLMPRNVSLLIPSTSPTRRHTAVLLPASSSMPDTRQIARSSILILGAGKTPPPDGSE
jgi:putative transposase